MRGWGWRWSLGRSVVTGQHTSVLVGGEVVLADRPRCRRCRVRRRSSPARRRPGRGRRTGRRGRGRRRWSPAARRCRDRRPATGHEGGDLAVAGLEELVGVERAVGAGDVEPGRFERGVQIDQGRLEPLAAVVEADRSSGRRATGSPGCGGCSTSARWRGSSVEQRLQRRHTVPASARAARASARGGRGSTRLRAARVGRLRARGGPRRSACRGRGTGGSPARSPTWLAA